MIHIRRAGEPDARALAELLNAIIARGGTTAIVTPVSRDILRKKMSANPHRSAWHVAESHDGDLLGFQYVQPHNNLPPEACDIATFVRIGETGLGIGSRLFPETCSAARVLGYRWINATIRADNSGGLAYYQSRGFEDYGFERGLKLDDGTKVDRISKRFEL